MWYNPKYGHFKRDDWPSALSDGGFLWGVPPNHPSHSTGVSRFSDPPPIIINSTKSPLTPMKKKHWILLEYIKSPLISINYAHHHVNKNLLHCSFGLVSRCGASWHLTASWPSAQSKFFAPGRPGPRSGTRPEEVSHGLMEHSQLPSGFD